MNFWFFILIPIGGLFLIGTIIDIIAKAKGKKVKLERNKTKSRSKTGDIYSTSLNQEKNNNLF